MSSDEFELTIAIVDRAGHTLAHGFLGRYHFNSGSRTCASRIYFNVLFDPSLLRTRIGELDSMK